MKTENVITKLKDLSTKRGALVTIHKDTDLPLSWLRKVARGNIPDPGSKRIDILKDYFTGSNQTKEEHAL